MNKPYVNVKAILEVLRMAVAENSSDPGAAYSLPWLAGFRAREHSTMNADDRNSLVHVGAQLWQEREAWDIAPGAHSNSVRAPAEQRPAWN
ncbi:hypothetical protein LJ655_26240 [Paraburkholderia sp. MMS20-SJTN17]|uniref:Uncharacterized protein n=1 Tax=Paraburkholderia translucens TaxID=2886945 RepID=A0ABS8KKM6_9BURK|nr:hypothetical protein [Paraburkholderia sp. MMS20-SJTN17]MCC8405316.1 hypothetical protein [Paraburkholderia sp. MMS20-SJTN17]